MAPHLSVFVYMSYALSLMQQSEVVQAARLAARAPHGAVSTDGEAWSALAGLPTLPKVHHSYRISNFSAQSPLHDDFVRITRACPLSLLDDNYWGEGMIVECVTAAARHNATLSINHSPWYLHYPSKDKTLAPDCCPSAEAAELAWYRSRLRQTMSWIATANHRLGANVSVGAVLLDAERWLHSQTNASWNTALTRKHTLMFDATAELLPGVTLQWYDRGGYTYDGMGTGFFAPSGYYTLDEPGTVFSTSLYGLGQVGYTREQYSRTVELAANHSVDVVTPWVALGCGNKPNFHTQGFSMQYNYPVMNSWMIGRDINVPGPFPERIVGCEGGFHHAVDVALYPAPISSWDSVELADVTQVLQHFVAYVLGASCIQLLPNMSTATKGWSWGELERGEVIGTNGCYL